MATSPLQLLTEPDCDFSLVFVPLLQLSYPQHSWWGGREGSKGLCYKPGKISMPVKAKSRGFPLEE